LTATVILNDLDDVALTKATDSLGEKCVGVAGDSSDVKIIDSLIRSAVDKFGRLDFAVCNTGITTFGSFHDYSPDDFDLQCRVNLKGTFFLAQRASQQMIRQKTAGRIVLMSSVTGHQYHEDLHAYGITKAGISFMAKSLGVELASHGITVNAISPCATITSRTQSLNDGKFEEIWKQIMPSGKCNSVEEVGHVAMFFLSSLSGNITGQDLVIDGGWTSSGLQPGDV